LADLTRDKEKKRKEKGRKGLLLYYLTACAIQTPVMPKGVETKEKKKKKREANFIVAIVTGCSTSATRCRSATCQGGKEKRKKKGMLAPSCLAQTNHSQSLDGQGKKGRKGEKGGRKKEEGEKGTHNERKRRKKKENLAQAIWKSIAGRCQSP